MESLSRPVPVRIELRDDLPDGEVVVPLLTRRGAVIAVCKGKMPEETHDALNRVLRHLAGTHILALGPGASLHQEPRSKE